MTKRIASKKPAFSTAGDYPSLVGGIGDLLETARRASSRTVNAFMTATYWKIGRRIVEFEQGGEKRAEYGKELLSRLSEDLTARFGRGFSRFNLGRFRAFYLASPADQIRATLSLKSAESEKRTTPSLESGQSRITQTPPANLPLEIFSTVSDKSTGSIRSTLSGKLRTASAQFSLTNLARVFPLSWSHYVLLISRSRSAEAFAFYHAEALRGGWPVRHLKRQMESDEYAREHWSQPAENSPVGVILCSRKSEALVRYATDSLPNKMLVREYLTALPDEKVLATELEKTRKQLEARKE